MLTLLYDQDWFNLDMVQEKEKRNPSHICVSIIKHNPLKIQCHFILGLFFLTLTFIMLCVFQIIRAQFGYGKQV